MRALSPFTDRPHHQGLAAAHVPAAEHAVGAAVVVIVVGGHPATRVQGQLQGALQPLGNRTLVADGDQYQLGRQAQQLSGQRLAVAATVRGFLPAHALQHHRVDTPLA